MVVRPDVRRNYSRAGGPHDAGDDYRHRDSDRRRRGHRRAPAGGAYHRGAARRLPVHPDVTHLGDLFDSYRNMFLALERLLSDIRPRAMRPNGKPAESEKDWFTAALQQADKLVPVAKLAPTGTQDPSDWVYINMYGAERSGLMHAKPGLYHLPQDDAGRADSGRRYAHCRITSTSWSAPTYTFSAASAASTHPAGRCLRSRSSKTWCSSLLTKNSPSPPGTMKP